MKEQQGRKNCQIFMNKLLNTNAYDSIRELLMGWKIQDKHNVPAAVDTFMKITKVVHGFGRDEKDDKLIQYFNRCLVKDATVPKKVVTADFVEEVAYDNPQSNQIINKVQQWVKQQTNNKLIQKPVQKPIGTAEELKDSSLPTRLESHPNFREIIKIIHIYLKSIITLEQLRNLLVPMYGTDNSLFQYLVETARDIIQKRRKATIFAPLNQLVDKKYPNLQQVGPSYILIPEGYANYSKSWKTNTLEYIMNRQCVSVPLGSEVSFIINKKTDYEEQLFNYEDQRYQIDNFLVSLKAVISILSSNSVTSKKLQSALVQKVINQIYPSQNIASFFIRHLQLAKNVLLPRVIQKRDQLISCRDKFVKTCEQVAAKNFYKSLDYRCFYFAKNDKKFNCPVRWQRQIEMRKKQILQSKDMLDEQQIQDRESLQRGRYFYVNSFDNITKQNFIENKQVKDHFEPKLNASYPTYPDNQILFILNFPDQQILNDVLEIILYNCHRKNLLELLIFKMMRTDIKKRLKKSPLLNYLLQTKQRIANSSEVFEALANSNNQNQSSLNKNSQQSLSSTQETLINDSKGLTKTFKDSEDQFMQMIQQQEEPVQLEEEDSPFQGPSTGYTFIATKHIYLFMRYVTAIYQRFYKAKQYSDQFSSTMMNSESSEEPKTKIDIYKFFITVMIYRLKDRKNYQQHLRKLFCKNAFIFFTLQKLILSAAKTISNIPTDSLSFQIIKDQTKDYQLGAFDWEKFSFPNVTMQLTRLFLQTETLFRFTYEPNQKNFYISSWNPPFKETFSSREKLEELTHKMQDFTKQTTKIRKQKLKLKKHNQKQKISEQIYNAEQITIQQAGRLMLKGEIVILNKQRNQKILSINKTFKSELNKIKKIRRII